MAYGLEIINSNGKIFATPETPFMHMTSRQNFSVEGSHLGDANAVSYNTGIPTTLRMVCYARCNSAGFMYLVQYASTGTWWLRIYCSQSVSGTFYLFTNDIPQSSGRWGLDVFNGSGQRIFSTSTKPLQNLQTALDRNGATTAQLTFPAAVIATPCQYWVQPIQGGLNVQFFIAAPCAHHNQIDLTAAGTGIMPAGAGFEFTAFGGLVNYINSSLYDT